MIADKDPAVMRALDLLVPPLNGDAEGLFARACVDAGRIRAARRRRRWVTGLAFAAVALLTGAAIAASKLNLLPFLQTHDRNSARFSVDQSRVYRGGSPTALNCPAAGLGAFLCTPTGTEAGARAYILATRVAAQPRHAPIRLADEVALVLAVQAGLLDALSLPDVIVFRAGMTVALDRDAAEAVAQIQATGTLDVARKQTLLQALQRYASSIASLPSGSLTLLHA